MGIRIWIGHAKGAQVTAGRCGEVSSGFNLCLLQIQKVSLLFWLIVVLC